MSVCMQCLQDKCGKLLSLFFIFPEDCVCTVQSSTIFNKSFSRKINLFCVKISSTFSKRDENYEFLKFDIFCCFQIGVKIEHF